jgi:hypothetical protein
MNYSDLITVEYNHEGAILLTALVKDTKNAFGTAFGPFYQTMQFYFYDNVQEAIEAYVSHTINELGYSFVEDYDEDFD